MPNQPRASALYSQGLQEWECGNLSEAEKCLREALSNAEPTNLCLDQYYGSLAGVLSQLGRPGEAGHLYEQAVQIAFNQTANDSDPSVVIARYFLAEHLLSAGKAVEALVAIKPSVGVGAKEEALLRFIEARAFHQTGDLARAKSSARLALDSASSEIQRNKFQESFAGFITLP